jgi:predicted 3-demethylubiquinone-9 3-methyltransferase (glyoxalase superfamily)
MKAPDVHPGLFLVTILGMTRNFFRGNTDVITHGFCGGTTDQAETDRYWNAIVGNGGEESACGWCKDKWGLSWQITPSALMKAITDPDRAAAKRAFDAMMKMKKIDIAAIEAARRG